MSTIDVDAVVAIARTLLDEVHDLFVNGLGAPRAVVKANKNDFATAVDLDLERVLTAHLIERTGIPVHGEEFGGAELDSPVVWVLDPIDGTANYSHGLPAAAILLGLLIDGEPVAGLAWFPFVDQRIWAVAGGPVHSNGVALPPLHTVSMDEAMVAFGAFNIDGGGRIPGTRRLRLLGELSRECARVRMHGSTGFDLAYTAAGGLDGAVVFGHRAWDNAAGVALVRAAGGVVSDLQGRPWTIHSRSVLAAAPGVHERLLELSRATLVDEPAAPRP